MNHIKIKHIETGEIKIHIQGAFEAVTLCGYSATDIEEPARTLEKVNCESCLKICEYIRDGGKKPVNP